MGVLLNDVLDVSQLAIIQERDVAYQCIHLSFEWGHTSRRALSSELQDLRTNHTHTDTQAQTQGHTDTQGQTQGHTDTKLFVNGFTKVIVAPDHTQLSNLSTLH